MSMGKREEPSYLLQPEPVAIQKFNACCPACDAVLSVEGKELVYNNVCAACKTETPTDWAEPVNPRPDKPCPLPPWIDFQELQQHRFAQSSRGVVPRVSHLQVNHIPIQIDKFFYRSTYLAWLAFFSTVVSLAFCP